MLLTCPHCGDSNELANDSLPPAGARGACRRCGQTAVFDGQGLAPEGGFEDATPSNPLATGGGADDATPPHPLDAVAAAEEASAAGDAWHLNTAAGEQGPLTLAALKQLIRKDELTEHDHVFGPGQSEWMEAGHREELKRYFAIKAQARARADGAASAVGVATAAAVVATTAAASVELNASDPFAWCTRHPAVEAAWICHACNLSWCASCPEERKLPGGTVRTCLNCQRPVAERKRAKAITLWWTEMNEVWAFPIKGMNWLALVILCAAWVAQLLSSGAGLLGFMGGLLISFSVLSWFVLVVRHLGLGGKGLPDLGKVEDYAGELIIPGLKALIVKVLTVVPLVLYSLFVVTPAVFEYGAAAAAAKVEQSAPSAWAEEEGDGETWEQSPTSKNDEQREAFIEAMRAMGNSEEEIEEMLAGFDEEQREDAPGWAPGGGWGDGLQPDPPSLGGLILKLIGIPVLLLYALIVWPLLLIIVALFNTIAPAFNPPLILRIASEVWPEYKRLLLILIPLGILSFVLDWFADPSLGRGMQAEQMGFPPFVRIVFVPAFFYIQLVMMYLIGRTAELIDRKIDWF